MRDESMAQGGFAAVVFILLLCLSVFCFSAPGLADDRVNRPGAGGGLDELIDEFEEMGEISADKEKDPSGVFMDAPASLPPSAVGSSVFSLDGYLKLGMAYNFAHDRPVSGQTDWRGLSKLRGELQLELNVTFSDDWQGLVSAKGFYDAAYRVRGRKGYTEGVLDEYEDELELRETVVVGRLGRHLDIRFGRQIAVWGKSDTIRVTDVLNPLDNREPGMTDLEDLRLPLTMTKLDYYFGPWNVSGIAVHEIRFDKNPVFGSDFFPYPIALPKEIRPGHGGGNTEWALAVKGTFSGWDASVFYADLFWDTPYLQIVGSTWPIRFRLRHPRVSLTGCAVNAALGNWILKSEAAVIDGLKYFGDPAAAYTRIDALVGAEYYGFDDMVIIVEAANRHINGFKRVLKQPPDEKREDAFQSVIRISRTFLNETMALEALLVFFGLDGKEGKFQRLSGEYALTDAVHLKGGFLLYQSGDLPEFAAVGDNDRFFAEVKYHF